MKTLGIPDIMEKVSLFFFLSKKFLNLTSLKFLIEPCRMNEVMPV